MSSILITHVLLVSIGNLFEYIKQKFKCIFIRICILLQYKYNNNSGNLLGEHLYLSGGKLRPQFHKLDLLVLLLKKYIMRKFAYGRRLNPSKIREDLNPLFCQQVTTRTPHIRDFCQAGTHMGIRV